MSLNWSRLFLFNENGLFMRWSTPRGRLGWQVPCQMGSAWPWHQSPLTPLVWEQCLDPPPANIPVPVCPSDLHPLLPRSLFNVFNLLSQEDSWVRSYVFEQPGGGGVLFPKMLAESIVPNDSPWEGVEHADPEQAAGRTAVSLEKIILVFFKLLSFAWTQAVPKFDGTRSASCWQCKLNY